MHTISGNLLEIDRGILCHQVNMFRAMGHGLALQVKLKWPDVYEAYFNHTPQLGDCLMVPVMRNLWVANLYGQAAVGGLGPDDKKTHYGHLAHALALVYVQQEKLSLPVYIPWHMSADLAGGDWAVVEELIEGLVPDATIVQLPNYQAYLDQGRRV